MFRSVTAYSPERISLVCRSILTICGILLLLPSQLLAGTYYVDDIGGSDDNSGLAESAAFRTISRINSLLLFAGDSVLFRRGQSFDGVLDIDANGSNSNPIRVGAWGAGENPVLYGIDLRGDYLEIEELTVDHRKDPSDAIRLRGARNCVMRNMVVRNGTRDAVDVDQGDGLLVEDMEIHHFLNGTFGSEDDSHGFAITNTDGVTIRRANIHHVSGDSLQADPNRVPGGISDNIVIEDSELWTGPLEETFNAGWQAGNSPGENAIDTKVLQSGFANEIRMKITLRNVIAHGWTEVPEISNRAVFNLKEKISAELERVTVYNSQIAFRIRGALGNAETLISNAVIYDVGIAIRAEDDLTDLRVYNSTFGHGITQQLRHAGGNGGVATWDWRNNAFIDTKPGEADDPTNIVANDGDFVSVDQRNYALVAAASLVDAGAVIPAVSVDRDGNPRSAPYDSGAYELQDAGPRPNPPILVIE